jgi:ribosomal protein L22
MPERRKKDPEKEETAEKRRRRLGRRSKTDATEATPAAETVKAEQTAAPAGASAPPPRAAAGQAAAPPADVPVAAEEPVADAAAVDAPVAAEPDAAQPVAEETVPTDPEPEPADEPVVPKPAAKRSTAAKAAAANAVADEPAADAVSLAKPKRRGVRGRRAEADKPAAPAAKPKRAAHDLGDNPPMVRAHAKYVRTSARKARLVCDHIRGKSVEEARAILAHANRDVARDWSKLLESAVANAEHNHELIGDDLRIHAVKADEGPTLKRFRPRAMGRATKIRKRTSHLSITLTPMDRNQ